MADVVRQKQKTTGVVGSFGKFSKLGGVLARVKVAGSEPKTSAPGDLESGELVNVAPTPEQKSMHE